MKAVIQAGGKGTRLRPYTLVLPKPMMPVGDEPVIQILLKWLRRWDVRETCITTGYLGALIRTLCGDGSQWGMRISYSEEPEPLGTIGALDLIREKLTETFLMLNGDLITNLDLWEFSECHRKSQGLVTVAVTEKNVKVDLGVIDAPNGRITGFREKPEIKLTVSTGIYCMDPGVLDLIPNGVPFGFDDLMHVMRVHDLPVHVYRHNGLWMDLGQEKDFCHAQEAFLRDYKQPVLGA